MLRTLRALTQVLQIWWTKDRIRVARSEGKLFRIRVGDRLLIDETIFQVLTRHDSKHAVSDCVLYTLTEEQADSDDVWSLRYSMRSESSMLSHNGESRNVFNEQIYLLAPTSNWRTSKLSSLKQVD